jgi:hypothetical protein
MEEGEQFMCIIKEQEFVLQIKAVSHLPEDSVVIGVVVYDNDGLF